MKDSRIEWTDHTFNPWEGCTKVSPGCLHCYAETRNARWNKGTAINWGKGAPRRRTIAANWRKPLGWNLTAKVQAEYSQGFYARPRVFCASLADWLDDEVPIEWLADLLGLIHATPNLDWLLLTKRPGNWGQRIEAARDHIGTQSPDDQPEHAWIETWLYDEKPPKNVWIGTTVEDQTRADERIPLLLSIPARVRFLSCEPLLGAVDIPSVLEASIGYNPDGTDRVWSAPRRPLINWVICGGESGPGARPMERDWVIGLRDQCQAAGVAFHFKQWGGSNKKLAGRELDGRTWDELPTGGHEV